MTKRDLKEDSCLRASEIVYHKIELRGRQLSKQSSSLPKLAKAMAILHWTHLSYNDNWDYTSCDDFDDPEVDEVETSAEAKSPAAAKAPLKSKTNDASTKLPSKTDDMSRTLASPCCMPSQAGNPVGRGR